MLGGPDHEISNKVDVVVATDITNHVTNTPNDNTTIKLLIHTKQPHNNTPQNPLN